MFNFKPRIYRSAEGCCICRAKSSSSRFTESQKYEEDFVKCFDLKDPRRGQICNACVLLVKRYKRLPAGSQRHWGHVVDARAGPGTKTLMKVKRIKEEKDIETTNTQSRHIGKSMISEKFSKIFKKSKKIKRQTSPPPNRQNQTSLITKQPNSIDSDNDESSESSQDLSKTNSPTTTPTPTIVLFQTQTRASAFRSKHKIASNNNKPFPLNKSNDLVIRKPLAKFSGSKKRKKFKPKKLQQALVHDDDVKFFDENEWTKQTSCCGIFYECAKLNNAIIIDVEEFKVCQEHQTKEMILHELQQSAALKPKCVIKATLPAVVKLSLPLTALNSNTKSTPVLKKHHLYFKRQSESFLQEDLITTTNAVPILTTIKTDDNATEKSTANIEIENSTNTAVQAQHSSAFPAKTSINPTIMPSKATTANIKSSSFLHKIKSDAGKIVKHSFEKFNSAVRLKAQDLTEIKHLVKTVDKNCLLNMPTTPTAAAVATATTTSNTVIGKETEILKNSIAATTTTTSNKFSDNSSDSGFDENVQDRKSVSPMQQESDTKTILPPRPPVQTLILASGVRVHGQTQNLVYAGNEAAAKILQSRINGNTVLTNSKRLGVQVKNSVESIMTPTPSSVATLKLLHQPSKANPNCVVSIGAYGGVKMRALYNNNAIKHENGITTILPASSLAAANQANQFSMQSNAPNTITITPAVTAAAPPTSPSQLSSLHNNRSLTMPVQQHSAVGFQQPHHSDTLTHLHNRRVI